MKKAHVFFLMLAVIIIISGCVGKNTLNTDEAQSDCEKISGQIQRDICFEGIASETRNITWCEKIILQNIEDNCYFKNINANSADICEKISGHQKKDECFQEMVHSTGNFALCENIIKKAAKNDCYFYASLDGLVENANVCMENITGLEQRDICFNEVAVLTNNSSVCARIVSTNVRNECMYNVVQKN